MEHATPLSPILYAKVLGSSGGGGGMTEDFKQALLNAFENVAWKDGDGQQYIDALEAAMYPLSYITAVYTQSGTVYDTDSLDSLKADLVVTAFYQSGGSETVTNYTLSGTLTVGTSTVTVTYGGKTTTFDVTVSIFDTSPVIVTTGKYRNGGNNGATDASGWGITQKYKARWKQGDVYYLKVSNSTTPTVGIAAYTGTADTYSTSWSVTGTKTINVNYTFENCWLESSIKLADIADTYLYNNTTGDIVFAGANTPYYGKNNINE